MPWRDEWLPYKRSHRQTVGIDAATTARPGDTLGSARVFTHAQNPAARNDRLTEAGAIRMFTDTVTGKHFDRPGLADLIDRARPEVRLCVARLDRLGRSLRELLDSVDTLIARGIHPTSLKERLDTSSAASELIVHVFGAIAHFGARLISEKIRDEIAAAKKRSRKPGRRWIPRQFQRRESSLRPGWYRTDSKTTPYWHGNGLRDRQIGLVNPDVPALYLLTVIRRTSHATTSLA